MSEATLEDKPATGSLLRLRRGARQMFVSQGYHDTRPQDIARAAGVAQGTFYLYFKDKKAAFLDFAEQAQAELLVEYEANLKDVSPLRERWRVIISTVVEFAGHNPGLLQAAFLDPVFIAPEDESAWHLYDRLGNFVAMALEPEHPPGQLDSALISHAVCGMLRNAMVYARRKQIPPEKMIDDLSLFIDRGLAVSGEAPSN